MPLRIFIYFFLFSAMFLSCRGGNYVPVKIDNKLIPLASDCSSEAATQMNDLIQPYKDSLDKVLDHVIGYAPQTLIAGQPESSLSNFCTDALLDYARKTTRDTIDIAVLNFGGLRKPIPQGDISLRSIFELMPFDNEAVIVKLRAADLQELLDTFAVKGGEPVSGLRMEIAGGKAQHIVVGGEALTAAMLLQLPAKVYTIVTSDYLLGGTDKMTAFKKSYDHRRIGILRDIFIDCIKQRSAEGKPIEAKKDGRVYEK
ncbi:MAG: 5'-nucleotidase C-terminal domain-containing protein [Prevotellaceae bacterium]|jgi:2',3'-cyclic-nucleotide 2'-phosphodiesterase (5'-nucleotidase family)|nr:5'-nucleotidase C-terminal domain-containing protein [Prevotellaceae bacterium]